MIVDLDAQAGPPKGRIVFEVKTSRLSNPEAVKELDMAMEGRSAAFGVLVVPVRGRRSRPKMRALQEIHGNKLVVTFDPEDGGTLALETGYALARARVLMARSESGGVDAAAIEEAADARDRAARRRQGDQGRPHRRQDAHRPQRRGRRRDVPRRARAARRGLRARAHGRRRRSRRADVKHRAEPRRRAAPQPRRRARSTSERETAASGRPGPAAAA